MSSPDECRLPPELLDIVVDHLHDDPTTLRSLAITSTQCLHSSRVHLFYRIQLMHHPSAEYHQTPSRVLDKYYRLNKILETSPRLRGYIRHLVIHRAEFSHWVWYHIEPVVVQILDKLKNVSILSLRRVDFAWLSHFVRSPLRSMMLGTVVHLELYSCRFHDLDEFFHFIAGSNLKQLGVKEVAWAAPCVYNLLLRAQTTIVESLHLGDDCLDVVMPILLENDSPLCLQRLSKLSISPMGNYETAAKVIKHSKLTLEELEVAVTGSRGNNLPLYILRPSDMSCLRQLKLTHVRQSEGYSPIRCIMSLLSQIHHCDGLEGVSFMVIIEAPIAKLDWSKWRAVDEVLARLFDARRSLKSVHITMSGDASDADVWGLFGKLPELHRRRLLWMTLNNTGD
ncbi:hypothetical protein K443DRAFT_677213 [Laccaria amethystina LaAM-08-1]|uniref:F-box domain-containing protein n=1 Tax=Laccaria amethystina LaAM-08-1 TaxID=1095629 RepID=A0A0C9XMZ0_9AGAR|nr:hypothetical protein K443DRAFT_677213 [Laccaria amethystina LaAM-08-1]